MCGADFVWSFFFQLWAMHSRASMLLKGGGERERESKYSQNSVGTEPELNGNTARTQWELNGNSVSECKSGDKCAVIDSLENGIVHQCDLIGDVIVVHSVKVVGSWNVNVLIVGHWQQQLDDALSIAEWR